MTWILAVFCCAALAAETSGDPPTDTVHIEITYSRSTFVLYRRRDGSGTLVTDDWRGTDNTRTVTDIPAPPEKDEGWSMCASDFLASALFQQGRLLFINGRDDEQLLVATVDGVVYSAVVPGRSRRIGPGPKTWQPIEGAATIVHRPVGWKKTSGSFPVSTVGAR